MISYDEDKRLLNIHKHGFDFVVDCRDFGGKGRVRIHRFMGGMIERLAIAPEIHRCRYRDDLYRHELAREVVYSLQANLWPTAIHPREITRVGLASDA